MWEEQSRWDAGTAHIRAQQASLGSILTGAPGEAVVPTLPRPHMRLWRHWECEWEEQSTLGQYGFLEALTF